MCVGEGAASVLAPGETFVDHLEGDLFDLGNNMVVGRVLVRHVQELESAVDLGRKDPHRVSERLENLLRLGEEIRGFAVTELAREDDAGEIQNHPLTDLVPGSCHRSGGAIEILERGRRVANFPMDVANGEEGIGDPPIVSSTLEFPERGNLIDEGFFEPAKGIQGPPAIVSSPRDGQRVTQLFGESNRPIGHHDRFFGVCLIEGRGELGQRSLEL